MVAIYQNIVYNEMITEYVGRDYADNLGLTSRGYNGYYNGYNSKINATICKIEKQMNIQTNNVLSMAFFSE